MQPLSKIILPVALFCLSAVLAASAVFQANAPAQYVVSASWDKDPTMADLFAHPLLNTALIGQVTQQTPVAGHLLESDLHGGQMPYWEVTVAVTEYLANPLPYKQIKVLLPGGATTVTGSKAAYQAEVVIADAGEAMHAGEQVLLFLGKDDSWVPLQADEFTLMYGSARGLFHLTGAGNAYNQRETVALSEARALAQARALNMTPTPMPKDLVLPTATPATADK